LVGNISSLVDFHVYGQREEVRFGYPPELLNLQLRRLKDQVDIAVAGPPCQGHSNLNNHTRRDDPRNQLYLTAVAIAVSLNSKCIIIENVPTVLNDYGNVIGKTRSILVNQDYDVSEATIKAETIGAPQRRARHFVIATKKGSVSLDNVFSAVLAQLAGPPTTLSWAIGDLLDRNSTGLMDASSAMTGINQGRIDYLFDNEQHDLPDHERPDCHKDGTTYTAVYGRMHWDQPTHTITTGFNSPGQGRYIHPLRRRVITPHEAARIQLFPDWYSFAPVDGKISRKRAAKCIGEAVPPILGYAAGLSALSHALCSGFLERFPAQAA
jgi:DNA (cytosine-5)-methyltransferase 1